MTKLFFTTAASRPEAILPLPDDEPSVLELQRWEDDGGAAAPDTARAGRARGSFRCNPLDQVAA